jgi:hypothetical protein
MGLFYAWQFFMVPEGAFASLESEYDAAVKQGLPQDVAPAIDTWRRDPGFLEAAARRLDEHYGGPNEDRLAQVERLQAIIARQASGTFLPEDRETLIAMKDRLDKKVQDAWSPYRSFLGAFACESFAPLLSRVAGSIAQVSLEGVPPAAILWQGLGPERAMRLPGFFGNMLVRAEAVAAAREQVRAALDVPRRTFTERARVLRHSQFDDATVARIHECLPQALAQALEGCTGFLALSGQLVGASGS